MLSVGIADDSVAGSAYPDSGPHGRKRTHSTGTLVALLKDSWSRKQFSASSDVTGRFRFRRNSRFFPPLYI